MRTDRDTNLTTMGWLCTNSVYLRACVRQVVRAQRCVEQLGGRRVPLADTYKGDTPFSLMQHLVLSCEAQRVEQPRRVTLVDLRLLHLPNSGAQLVSFVSRQWPSLMPHSPVEKTMRSRRRRTESEGLLNQNLLKPKTLRTHQVPRFMSRWMSTSDLGTSLLGGEAMHRKRSWTSAEGSDASPLSSSCSSGFTCAVTTPCSQAS